MPAESTIIRLLFVTVADNYIGFGHLSRCLSIAAHAATTNASIAFLVFGDEQAGRRVTEAGYQCCLRSISDLAMAKGEVFVEKQLLADTIVVDLAHPGLLASPKTVIDLFVEMRRWAKNIVAIDSLGEQSLAIQAPEIPINILVVPYVAPPASRPEKLSPHWRLLQGPTYALLSPCYSGLPFRNQRVQAGRILVTCGGSDPKNMTSLVLKGLEKVPGRLKIHVIKGPLFSEKLCSDLDDLSTTSQNDIEIFDAPESLVEHMLWCDLAIATSGLTKYEFAATATPAILFSIDELHDLNNRPFATLGSVLDLGIFITPQLIADEANRLLCDHDVRVRMAAAGKNMVDGLGSQRLLTEIRKELLC